MISAIAPCVSMAEILLGIVSIANTSITPNVRNAFLFICRKVRLQNFSFIRHKNSFSFIILYQISLVNEGPKRCHQVRNGNNRSYIGPQETPIFRQRVMRSSVSNFNKNLGSLKNFSQRTA